MTEKVQNDNENYLTSDSFHTPNKNKNVSAIQTNPSSSFGMYPLHQYSSIQLSESLHASPSFYSPNKQISSYLITPNYSSSQIQSPGFISEMRLKTESQVDKSKFEDSPMKQNIKIPVYEVKNMLMLLKQHKFQKQRFQSGKNQLKSIDIQNQFLIRTIQNKQEDISEHKRDVQALIEKRKQLKRKIQLKKNKNLRNEKKLIEQIQSKIKSMSQQYNLRQKEFKQQLVRIQRFQKQSELILSKLKQKYDHKPHTYNNHMNQHHYPQYPQYPVQPNYFNNQDAVRCSKQYSSTNKLQQPYYQNSSVSHPSLQQNSYPTQKTSQLTNNFNNISPISKQNGSFADLLQLALLNQMKGNSNQNGQLSSATPQILKSIPPIKLKSPEKYETKSNVESQIDIQYEGLYESPLKNRNSSQKQSQLSSARRKQTIQSKEQAQKHKRVSSGQSPKSPQNYAQSEVNINYQNSQFSDNLYGHHQFSPRTGQKVDQIGNRRRSPTYQQHPNTFQGLLDLRKTDINKSQYKGNDSGEQTPIFRSEVTQSQLKFSQPLLASFKNSQNMNQNIGQSQKNIYDFDQDNTAKFDSFNQKSNKQGVGIQQKKRKHSSEVLEPLRIFKMDRQGQLPQIYSEKNQSSSDEQHNKNLNEDDDFFSCTLGTDSKISLKQKENSSPFEDMNQDQSQKAGSSSLDQNFDAQQFQNEFALHLRSSTPSNIVKVGNSKIVKRQDNDNSRSSFSNNKLKKIKFETVPEQQSQEDSQENHSRYSERKNHSHQQMSKSTL